jgi:hypothetical protein
LAIVAYEGGQHIVGLYEDNNNDGVWDQTLAESPKAASFFTWLQFAASGDATITVYNHDASTWDPATVNWSNKPVFGPVAQSFTVNAAGHYSVDVLSRLQSVQENGTVGVSIVADQNMSLSTNENNDSQGVYLQVEYEPDSQ